MLRPAPVNAASASPLRLWSTSKALARPGAPDSFINGWPPPWVNDLASARSNRQQGNGKQQVRRASAKRSQKRRTASSG
jgi:hypothetical protein